MKTKYLMLPFVFLPYLSFGNSAITGSCKKSPKEYTYDQKVILADSLKRRIFITKELRTLDIAKLYLYTNKFQPGFTKQIGGTCSKKSSNHQPLSQNVKLDLEKATNSYVVAFYPYINKEDEEFNSIMDGLSNDVETSIRGFYKTADKMGLPMLAGQFKDCQSYPHTLASDHAQSAYNELPAIRERALKNLLQNADLYLNHLSRESYETKLTDPDIQKIERILEMIRLETIEISSKEKPADLTNWNLVKAKLDQVKAATKSKTPLCTPETELAPVKQNNSAPLVPLVPQRLI